MRSDDSEKQAGRTDIAVLILLTLIEIKAVNMMHIGTADRIISAAHGIVIGIPQWRIYQNRLLGPWSVFVLARLFSRGKYDHAYGTFTTTLLLAVNILTYILFQRLGQSRRAALRYACVGVTAFIGLQDQEWVFLWDYLDLLIFTAFAYGVYTRRGWPYFLVLFFIELFNREAAVYISLWMVLDSVKFRDEGEERAFPLSRKYAIALVPFLLGVVTFLGGAAWTQWVRLRLFKHSEFPGVGLDLEHLHGNILNLSGNGADFVKYLSATTPQLHFLDFLIIPALLVYFWRSRHVLSLRSLKLVTVIIAMLVGIILYAKIAEPRVFLSVIPLVLFLHWDIARCVKAQGPVLAQNSV